MRSESGGVCGFENQTLLGQYPGNHQPYDPVRKYTKEKEREKDEKKEKRNKKKEQE
ncbi:hypothetical protein SK128_015290, partial [Halocaridina rubra]